MELTLHRWCAFVVCIVLLSAIGLNCNQQTRCDSDNGCARGEICLLGVCLSGCRSLDDCDGGKFCVDFQCVPDECQPGVARLCYTGKVASLGVGLCRGGIQFCRDDKRWSLCSGEILAQQESCDRLDNDCNGKIDDGIVCDCQKPGIKRFCFPGKSGLSRKGVCRGGLQYCESDNRWGLCLGFVLPTAETCDGLDNDCDGEVDEGVACGCQDGETKSCYAGPPGTLGVGVCKAGTQVCQKNTWQPCVGSLGPSREVCDGKDNDCNGKIDDRDECIAEPPVDASADSRTDGQDSAREGSSDIAEATPQESPRESVADAGVNCTAPADPPCIGLFNLTLDPSIIKCQYFAGECKNGNGVCLRTGAPIGVEDCQNKRDDDCNGYIDDGPGCGLGSDPCLGLTPCVQTLIGPRGYWHRAQKSLLYPMFKEPTGIAFGPKRKRIYIADARSHRIWLLKQRASNGSWDIVLFAGAGTAGARDGWGVKATFNTPTSLVVDPTTSEIYVTDTGNHCIRKLSSSGRVTTFLGQCGASGYVEGTGANARFRAPIGLAIRVGGNDRYLYISDTQNHRIRQVQLGVSNAKSTLVAGAGKGFLDGTAGVALFDNPTGLAFGKNGILFIADANNRLIRSFNPVARRVDTLLGLCSGKICPKVEFAEGGKGTARFGEPTSLVYEATGDVLYAVDRLHHAVFKITLSPAPRAEVLIGSKPPTAVAGSADGDAATARLNRPIGLAWDGRSLIVSDTVNQVLRQIDPSIPSSKTIVGANVAGNPNTFSTETDVVDALLFNPFDVAYYETTAQGKLVRRIFFTELANSLRMFDMETGKVSVVLGDPSRAGNGQTSLATPLGMAVWGRQLYIADSLNNRIVRFDMFLKTPGTPLGTGLSGAADGPIAGVSFTKPIDVALADRLGNLLFVAESDKGHIRVGKRLASNQPIERFDTMTPKTGSCLPLGSISRLSYTPSGRRLYLVGRSTTGQDAKVCYISLDAQGAGTKAELFIDAKQLGIGATDIHAAANGSVFVTDFRNKVHKFDANGTKLWSIGALSGGGYLDGPGSLASFESPQGISPFKPGFLFVADSRNHRIRVIKDR